MSACVFAPWLNAMQPFMKNTWVPMGMGSGPFGPFNVPHNGGLGVFVKCCARGLIIILMDLAFVSTSAQVRNHTPG